MLSSSTSAAFRTKRIQKLDAFDHNIGVVIGRHVLIPVLVSGSWDKQWFDANCRRAYDAKQTAYRTWYKTRNADHWDRFVLARAVAWRVYGVARES